MNQCTSKRFITLHYDFQGTWLLSSYSKESIDEDVKIVWNAMKKAASIPKDYKIYLLLETEVVL